MQWQSVRRRPRSAGARCVLLRAQEVEGWHAAAVVVCSQFSSFCSAQPHNRPTSPNTTPHHTTPQDDAEGADDDDHDQHPAEGEGEASATIKEEEGEGEEGGGAVVKEEGEKEHEEEGETTPPKPPKPLDAKAAAAAARRAERAAAEEELKGRRRMLGNIQFIGHLYRFGMLTENIMHG